MAYKTKAEKKAFRAGMRYQEKRNIIWTTKVCENDGSSYDYLIKAPTAYAAKKKFDKIRKKYPKHYSGTYYTSFSKHGVNYDPL